MAIIQIDTTRTLVNGIEQKKQSEKVEVKKQKVQQKKINNHGNIN